LSRPGGKYIRIGRIFDSTGMITSPDIVSDNPFVDDSSGQMPTNHIFNLGLRQNPECKVVKYGDYDMYFGEVD